MDIANYDRHTLLLFAQNKTLIIIRFCVFRTIFLFVINFGLNSTGGKQQLNTFVLPAIFRTRQAALPIAIYSIHIRAGGKQQLHNLYKTTFCRHHQAGLTILVCCIHVSSGGQQRSDIVRTVPPRRIHQTCPAILINGVHIRAGGKQQLHTFLRRMC